MKPFVEALFQIAQQDLSEALQEHARDTLLLLGYDVTTEQRQYSASDVHPSQFTPFPPVASPPSVFLGLSDDATVASQLSRSDMSAFDTYVPIKVCPHARTAVCHSTCSNVNGLDRLLLCLLGWAYVRIQLDVY